MNNFDCAVAVMKAHREARNWTDEDVARDLVAQLGLDPAGEAANAKPVIPAGITEDEVVAHENAAKEAVAKAEAARAALEAQKAELSVGDETVQRLTEQRAVADAEVERQRSAEQRAAQLAAENEAQAARERETSSNLGHG